MSPASFDAGGATTKVDRHHGSGIILRRAAPGPTFLTASSFLLHRALLLASLALVLLFLFHYPSLLSAASGGGGARPLSGRSPTRAAAVSLSHRSLLDSATPRFSSAAVRRSAAPRRAGGLSVFVTGAAGFVGFHCSLALRARGDGVVGVDNFNAYYDPALKRARQSALAADDILVVAGDINDAALLGRIFESASFSHVLHLAAQAGVRHAMKAPMSYVQSNVAGLVSVLEAAAKRADPPPAVVWASSSSVYGLNTKTPFSESHRTDQPASLYAATKKAGEAIAHAYNHIYGLSITGLRFFTVYGPWGRPDMAYFSFAGAIVAGKPITLFRSPDGAPVLRDFTYIDDVIRGCVAAIDTAAPSAKNAAAGKRAVPPLRIYNLGNKSPVPVSRMVAILEKLLGRKAKKRVITMPANGDVPFTHANVTLAERDLGFRPATALDAGLRRFVEWYADYYKIDVPRDAAANIKTGAKGVVGARSVAAS